MEKLLASSPKISKLSRGQQVEGKILAKLNKELILEIGAKAEGLLPLKDFPKDQQETIKIGDKMSAFVILPENESGQVILGLNPQTGGSQRGKDQSWAKFQNAKDKKSKLQGRVLEINKGGLILEVEGTRGFLPNSQVGFELLVSLKTGLETLIGQVINVTVTDVDLSNNRLIFSQRGQVSEDVLEKLKSFKKDQKVRGNIIAILPFGLVIDLDPSTSLDGTRDKSLGTGGVEGLVFISDVSWEKVEDLGSKFQVGQEVEAQVLGEDSDLGRVNLSIKHLSEDPFSKLATNFEPDEVVKGQISQVSEAGVAVKLDPSVEGFLPASKMEADTKYEAGKEMSFLVDGVDAQRRRINLAPFVTSTERLIYK